MNAHENTINTAPFYELDWAPFLDWASGYARTEYARGRILALETVSGFASSVHRAQELQTETQEIQGLLDREALWGVLNQLPDLSEELSVIEKRGVFEVVQAVALRSWLYAFDSWSQFPQETAPRLFKHALSQVFSPADLIRHFDRMIGPTGEIRENASPKLAQASQRARETRIQIQNRLDQLLKKYSSDGVLQERYSDVREGRYVLPVKVSDQSKVAGRITEYSVSQQTVFIEPKEIEDLKLELRRAESEIHEEVFRLMKELSDRIVPYEGQILHALSILVYWDAVQARARVASLYGGRSIRVLSERKFYLQETANPILFLSLPESEIVRNTVDFQTRMLLLSGPNTGGKTVLLKLLGIAALCARTGFFFPGADRIEVPFFESFFIDIGDPQSIESHLSSFAGHVLKMRRILEEVSPGSLVLIDEMNSTTDPEEGAAIARAFLESVFAVEGAMVVATTHDPKLKALAVKDPRVLNASILFDEDTLRPTYRVIYGSPGRSRALETAQRLGFPRETLALARTFLAESNRVFEEVLSSLQQELAAAENERKKAVHFKREAEQLLEEARSRDKATVQDVLEKSRARLKSVIEAAQDDVREVIRRLSSAPSPKAIEAAREQIQSVFDQAEGSFSLGLREAAPELKEVLAEVESERDQNLPALQVGAWVRVPKWKTIGEVVEWDGKRARVSLGQSQKGALGSAFVVTVLPIEMEVLTGAETKRLQASLGISSGAKKVQVKIQDAPMSSGTLFGGVLQVDVRGKRLDDAMSIVSQEIDRAFRSGKSEFFVVHGFGTGALREGIRTLVKTLPYVSATEEASGGGALRVFFSR